MQRLFIQRIRAVLFLVNLQLPVPLNQNSQKSKHFIAAVFSPIRSRAAILSIDFLLYS